MATVANKNIVFLVCLYTLVTLKTEKWVLLLCCMLHAVCLSVKVSRLCVIPYQWISSRVQ